MLLSLLFIFFIGRAFYTLAEDHLKNKWLFAILGATSYYVGAFIGGVLVDIYYIINESQFQNPLLAYIEIPLGFLTCWIFYRILKSFWNRKSSVTVDNEILDANLLNNKTDL